MGKRSRQPGLVDRADGTDSGQESSTEITKATTVKKEQGTLRKVEFMAGVRKPNPKPALPVRTAKEIKKTVRNKLVVGVDFGTTYTGLSHVWGSISDARDVVVITDYPMGARNNERLEKVPTKIAYAAENDDLEEDVWGFEVESRHKAYTWFKLLLDESESQVQLNASQFQGKVGNGMLKTPVDKTGQDLATDYMSFLYKHVMERLEEANGKPIMKETPISFWFTYPAKWGHDAINATVEAATKAGFATRKGDALEVITEPEAAAMAILSKSIDKGKDLYKAGMNVLVADFGGGTLDFQVLKLISMDPLKTEEAIVGDMAKMGTFFIDCNFIEWCEEKFGEPFRKLPNSKTSMGSELLNGFELIRKSFSSKTLGKTFRLHMVALGKNLRAAGFSSPNYDFDDSEILIHGSEVEKLFAPTVKAALDLARSQLKALEDEKQLPYKIIALCGGLGGSRYIWECFNKFCKEDLKNQVQVVTDENAWSAICLGAAIRGLEGNKVLSKRAKRSYGVRVHRAFREGIDKEEDAFECPVEHKRADGYVDFSLLRKGARITNNMQHKVETYAVIEPDMEDEELIFEWDLYSCAEDVATLARIEDKGVKRLQKIRLDLRGYYGKKKRAKGNAGASKSAPEKMQVNIVLELAKERGLLDVRALHKRATVGSTQIDYGKDNQRPGARSAGAI